MVELKDYISEEEDRLLGEIHVRVCEELRELIEDYLIAVKEEVDTINILKDVSLAYKDINFSLRLPADRQAIYQKAIDEENNKDDMPKDMFI